MENEHVQWEAAERDVEAQSSGTKVRVGAGLCSSLNHSAKGRCWPGLVLGLGLDIKSEIGLDLNSGLGLD